MNRISLAGLALVTMVGTLLSPGVASADAPATPTSAPSSCFWFGPTFTIDEPSLNYAYPDSGATYWAARFTMPAGAHLVLKGDYPHARYQSFNSYNSTSNSPTDAIHDVSIKPDAGSANPFLPGARRTTSGNRSYAVTVLNETPPTQRAVNTLYAGVDGQTSVTLVYRVYVHDANTEVTGGVGLPKPELHMADGRILTGQDACDATDAATTAPPFDTMPLQTYLGLRDQPGKPATFPAASTPVWRAYYNSNFTVQCGYLGNCGGDPARTGGQYSNIDNNYVASFINRQFGPVLVLRGKLPVTPKTRAGQSRMASKVDLRYWSLCNNEGPATTKGVGCLSDEDVPTRANGRYTIVVSLPQDRPRNATKRCGVAWLPLSPDGDGAGHTDDGYLLMRNMLPSADFTHAVQDTKTPGDEKAVMGSYLPTGRYMSVKQFEKHGCCPRN